MTNNDTELISVDEDLKNILKTNVTDIRVPVVVVLREQPANDISKMVKREYKKDLDDISKPARKGVQANRDGAKLLSKLIYLPFGLTMRVQYPV